MGGKQSALKKQVAALQAEARKKSTKHQEELDAASKEKRLLQVKIDELQAIVVQAQQEAEKSKSDAHKQEERMKALKWELVRQLKVTGSPISSPRATLTPSASARIPLNWRLNEDVTLRQSSLSPTKQPDHADTSDNVPAPTPATSNNLLASLRPLVGADKQAEANMNQIADTDAKASSKMSPRSTASDSKTRSEDPPPSEVKHSNVYAVKRTSEEEDEENTSSKFRTPVAESKHGEDE